MRALLFALLIGCGGPVSDTVPPDGQTDGQIDDDAITPYSPSTPFTIATLHNILVDSARSRTVDYDVVYPTNATGARPVVVWSHGGLVRGGSHDGTDGWSEWLAAAGYVVIVPFHIPEETQTAFTPMCADNNIPAVECRIWIGMFTHRPLDASFLIDSLADIEAASPALAGKLDRERIAVGGHSAGTTSGLSMLGATQQWVPTAGPYTHIDPRVDAVLAASPQGPRNAGFASGFGNRSFETIDRPMLSVTGMGDDTGEPARSRRAAYETALPGDQWLSWDLDVTVGHDTFNREDCDGALADRCAWFGAIGIAFLDAYVAENPAALEWLSSTSPTAAANGALELTRR
ncbi:MAG: alpha/beta hydrolase family protein [Kofleriaceae bacterium]